MYPQFFMPQIPQFPQPQMQMFNQQQQAQQQPVQQMPVNNASSFIRVQNEAEAKSYPVEPNKSIIFKDDNAPYIYTKTMDASQLSQPIFERYRLVKEEDADDVVEVKTDAYMEELKVIKDDIAFIKGKLSENPKSKKPVVKGGDTDE